MTNKTQTKHALLASIMALLLCFTMLLGTTFAWFTDSVTSATNKIVAGNLDVELYHTNGADTNEPVGDTTTLFDEVALWEPGAMVWEKLTVKNNGSLTLKYNLSVNITDISTVGEKSLADVLKVAVMDKQPTRENVVNAATQRLATFNLASDSALTPGDSDEFYVAIYWAPSANDNDYNVAGEQLYAKLGVTLLATQYTAESDSFDHQYDKDATYPEINTVDTWDGSADISWYLENPDATEYTLSTAEALVGLANLVDGTAALPADVASEITQPVTFDGKTVKLDIDVDLYKEDENGELVCFDPIGSYRQDKAFTGTFDGQGHTIKNLNQNTWALDNGFYYGDLGLGLFGAVEDAHIKDLKIDNASISGYSAIVGIVAACTFGDTTFENITVTNSEGADYQYYAGGIVGWAAGTPKFINCNVDASTTLAAQWGDFDNSTGGVIGGASGNAEIYMEKCNVACRIDAYNDVTSSYQWYAYRRCGMLIGNTSKTADNNGTTVAAAPQLTCKDVTVTYGEWANYTYCEFAGTSWPYVRVQAGVSNSAYSNPRYGHPVDANGNEVIDDNHTHNAGEDHFILCAFDQLYGGGQGVYGTATHEGVTVIYNNN